MRLAILSTILLAVLLGGCQSPHPEPEKSPLAGKIGQRCIVQFRRGDGLGAGGGLPVAPTVDVQNGAEISLGGILRSVSGKWIVVEREKVVGKEKADVKKIEYYIPQESILMIEFNK